MIATFASQKLLDIARKLHRNYVTQILIHQFVPCLTHMKYQCLFLRYVPVFTVLPSLEDEDDVCESDENHGHASDTDFVNTSTKELEPYSGLGGGGGGGGQKALSLVPVFPM